MAVAIITENTSGGDFTGLTSTYIRTDGEEDSNFASDTADIIGRASAQYRSLIRPSGLSNITAPVTVTAATLQLYVTTQSAAMDAELWAVVRNWVLAQVTWNNYATATAWATAGGMGSGDIDASSSGAYTMAESTGAYQTLTLTGNALTNLQDWINGGRTNNGWLLAPSPDTATRYRFYTSDGGTDGQRPILTVTYSAASSAAVTGTAGDGCTEAQVVAGGETIIITLTGDTWVASGGTFDAIRDDIIAGLDSAQSQTDGWNARVRDVIAVTSVVRTSDTVVTITLPAVADYSISATETITVTVPAVAVVLAAPITATPTFNVTTSTVSAALTGTLSDGATETEIVAGGQTAILTLTNDTWVASGATFNAQRQAIIDGFDAASSPATGWNNEVRDNAAVTEVVRTSDRVVTVTFAAQAAYDITATETITVTIPAAALLGNGAIVASPTFNVTVASATTTGGIRTGANFITSALRTIVSRYAG